MREIALHTIGISLEMSVNIDESWLFISIKKKTTTTTKTLNWSLPHIIRKNQPQMH